MIAADTSSFVSFFRGDEGEDTRLIAQALEDRALCLPPPVLTELLSDRKASPSLEKWLLELPLLELTSGFWLRAGALRRKLIIRGLRARLGDVLIAQLCIDNRVRLITRDADFKSYVKLSKLRLAASPAK